MRHRAVRALLAGVGAAAAAAAAALAACDDPTAPRWMPDGEWAFTMQTQYFGVACTTSGNLVIAPAEQSTITARSGGGLCDFVGGAVAHLAASDTANEITFSSPNCEFSGTAVASDSIAGSVDCDIGFGVHRAGTWAAGRVGSAARIEFATSARMYAVGTTQNITVTITDARGRPLYGRVPWWSTSNVAVARVTPEGTEALLQAGGIGSAIVAASYGVLADTMTVQVSMPRFTTIAVGTGFSCGITASGEPWCWGGNGDGQLGEGTNRPAFGPVRAQGGVSLTAIDARYSHVCGVSAAALHCWGDNRFGQIGVGDTVDRSIPVPVAGTAQFTQVAAGTFHSCGLAANRIVSCWGGNMYGQLGTGDLVNRATPAAVAAGHSFRQVSAGSLHSCALTEAGDAWCWGSNVTGALGNGSGLSTELAPAPVAGGHAFASIDASEVRTCALDTAGAAYCWGLKHWGLFDIGIDSIARQPVRVAAGHTFTVFRTGNDHSCGLDADGAAWCWGANWYGQLGDGTFTQRTEPTRVAGGRRFRAIAVGGGHTCAIATDGVTYCWGANGDGQLGDGSAANHTFPGRVSGQP